MFLEKGRRVFKRDCLENGCVCAYAWTFLRTTQSHSSISFYYSAVYNQLLLVINTDICSLGLCSNLGHKNFPRCKKIRSFDFWLSCTFWKSKICYQYFATLFSPLSNIWAGWTILRWTWKQTWKVLHMFTFLLLFFSQLLRHPCYLDNPWCKFITGSMFLQGTEKS